MSTSGPLVIAAVLAAAGLHAGWNAIVKGVTDRLGLVARMGAVEVVLAVPLLWVITPPARAAWPWLGASVTVHVAYNLALLAAYRLGEFNMTYPLARGLGPLLVAAVAAIAIDEPLAPVPAMGVVLIASAIAVLGLTPWRRIKANRSAVLAAVLTGVTIATYTVIDGVGVRRSGSAIGYAAWLVALLGVTSLMIIVPLRARQAAVRRTAVARHTAVAWPTPAAWRTAAAAGIMSSVAYGLVLWAQTRGTLAAVAALRESSVVVAAILGVVIFKEPMGRIRIAASIAVATGVVLLAVPT